MKNVLALLVLSAVAVVTTIQPSLGESQTPVRIIITEGGSQGDGPRSPENVPILGGVIGNSIYLSFLTSLGDIEIRLEEEEEGLILNTVIDSSDGGEVILFSGASGIYTISFTLECGTVYIGRFVI